MKAAKWTQDEKHAGTGDLVFAKLATPRHYFNPSMNNNYARDVILLFPSLALKLFVKFKNKFVKTDFKGLRVKGIHNAVCNVSHGELIFEIIIKYYV